MRQPYFFCCSMILKQPKQPNSVPNKRVRFYILREKMIAGIGNRGMSVDAPQSIRSTERRVR